MTYTPTRSVTRSVDVEETPVLAALFCPTELNKAELSTYINFAHIWSDGIRCTWLDNPIHVYHLLSTFPTFRMDEATKAGRVPWKALPLPSLSLARRGRQAFYPRGALIVRAEIILRTALHWAVTQTEVKKTNAQGAGIWANNWLYDPRHWIYLLFVCCVYRLG